VLDIDIDYNKNKTIKKGGLGGNIAHTHTHRKTRHISYTKDK